MHADFVVLENISSQKSNVQTPNTSLSVKLWKPAIRIKAFCLETQLWVTFLNLNLGSFLIVSYYAVLLVLEIHFQYITRISRLVFSFFFFLMWTKSDHLFLQPRIFPNINVIIQVTQFCHSHRTLCSVCVLPCYCPEL